MEPENAVLPTAPKRVEPYVAPVNGVVQPAVYAPQNRPGRLTNQLEHLRKAIKHILKSPKANPFRAPVNAIHLKIPHYHELIKFPMDLGTINKRLKNQYYWSASEAIEDFNLMLNNCRAFNEPDNIVVGMANEVEQMFKKQIADMPVPEIVIGPPIAKSKLAMKLDAVGTAIKKMWPARHAASGAAPISMVENTENKNANSLINNSDANTAGPNSEVSAAAAQNELNFESTHGGKRRRVGYPASGSASEAAPATATAAGQHLGSQLTPKPEPIRRSLADSTSIDPYGIFAMQKKFAASVKYTDLSNAEAQRLKIFSSLFTAKNVLFAWPFVDMRKSANLILEKLPLSFSVIKKKLKNNEFKNEDEFAAGMRESFALFEQRHAQDKILLGLCKRSQSTFESLYKKIVTNASNMGESEPDTDTETEEEDNEEAFVRGQKYRIENQLRLMGEKISNKKGAVPKKLPGIKHNMTDLIGPNSQSNTSSEEDEVKKDEQVKKTKISKKNSRTAMCSKPKTKLSAPDGSSSGFDNKSGSASDNKSGSASDNKSGSASDDTSSSSSDDASSSSSDDASSSSSNDTSSSSSDDTSSSSSDDSSSSDSDDTSSSASDDTGGAYPA